MQLTDRDRSLLFAVLEDCAAHAGARPDVLLESLERRLGLRHTVVFEGCDPAAALASLPLAARGRSALMAEPYCERYYRDDVFRTPPSVRRIASEGVLSLHDVEPALLDGHPAYVRDFHGKFGTRSIVLVNVDVRPGACAVLCVQDFDGDLPTVAVRRLQALRRLLGPFLRDVGELRAASKQAPRLTRREQQIVALVSGGLSNAEIAAACAVKADSVKRYLTAIYAAYGVANRTQLALAAGAGAQPDR